MWLARDDFKEEDHPRGQPGNAGQFGSGGGGVGKSEKEADKPEKAEEKGGVEKPKYVGKYKVAPRAAQAAGVDNLADTMKQLSDLTAKYRPAGTDDTQSFVLKHGFPYTANDKTYEGKKGKPQQCYMNATQDALANPERNYVEGFVSVHGVPIQHAWTVDPDGQIHDPTLKDGNGVDGYYGVPFSSDYLLKSTLKNKVYGLLGHESKKTIGPLMSGEAKDFREQQDIDKLSPEVIKDRLGYARRAAAKIPSTEHIDTPERKALRKQIADDLYNQGIEGRRRNREATIVLGLPASGKSTLAGPIIQEQGALEVDPDLAKQRLPEYNNGVGANAVHEESSMIARDVMAQALKNGDNIVWPRVNSPQKMVQSIKDLKRLGYKVHVKMLDVPSETAQKSAVSRYMSTGRFVDPAAIEAAGNSPMESYKVSKELADSSELYERHPSGSGIKKVDE